MLKALSEQITRADELVVKLRDPPNEARLRRNLKSPRPPNRSVNWPTGSRTEANLSQLRAAKNAATVHRDRVQGIPNGQISEGDRSVVIAKWNSVLQQADRAQAKVLTMRDKLLGAITELRVRQVGISEELLAGSL